MPLILCILCTAENLKIDEQDCELDFFDLTDWLYDALRRNGKIRTQDTSCKAVAIFLVWIRTLRGLRYPGIGSLSEYEAILKIFAIYVKFSALQSITA